MAAKTANAHKMEKKKSPWLIFFLVLLGIFALFFIFAILGIVGLLFSEETIMQGNVAVIPIHGVISYDNTKSYVETGTSAKKIIELIDKAEKDSMKAIIFDINSPGGSAVASYEIAERIAQLQEKDIPTVAVIHEVGASGAYWIAAATDYIIANELSMTGSIGVISSYLEFTGLLQKYNVTYQRLVAGKYKDAGSPLKQLDEEERTLFQHKLDAIHAVFIREVAKHRNLLSEEVKRLADGFVYLGSEAKDNGLVDQLGGIEEAKRYIKAQTGVEAELVDYKPQSSFFDLFSEVISSHGFSIGSGIGAALTEQQTEPLAGIKT